MNLLSTHLRVIGSIFIFLAFIHILFPKRFEWKSDLKPLSLINRQMMHVHTFFIALFVFLNGLLFFLYSKELLQPSPLQRAVVWGMLIFWGIRGLFQHFFYSPALWRRKRFETIMHILFSLLWTYVIVILIFILERT